MLSQLNTTKLNEIMPTLNIFILNTHVGIGLYTTPTSAKWLVMFCSVPWKVVNMSYLRLLGFGKTQRFEIWALNCTKMRLAAGLRPDPLGELLPFLLAFDAPLGVPRRHGAIRFGMAKPEWWFVSTQYERDRDTDRWTPHNGIGRACIASRGNIHAKTCIKLKIGLCIHANVQHVNTLFRNSWIAHSPATNLLDFLWAWDWPRDSLQYNWVAHLGIEMELFCDFV